MKKKYCRPKIEDIDVVSGELVHFCDTGNTADRECTAGPHVHIEFGCEGGDHADENCNVGTLIAVPPVGE